MKKVGIIMVNYKDYANRFLIECRDALRAQTYPKEFIKIYIVDNASSEESRKFLADNFSEAIILSRGDGDGVPAEEAGNYAAANNAGIKKGIADGCELFVFANMDVRMDARWLEELVTGVDDDAVGIAQSLIYLYPKTEEERRNPRINSIGNIFHFLGFGYTGGYGKLGDLGIGGMGNREISGYASGCSFIIKKEVLEKIGGYEEELYMYHDDIDISLKARAAGYKIVLASRSIIYHKYEFERSVRMLYYMERNRYIEILAFYHWATLVLIWPPLLIMDLGLAAYSILNQWSDTKLEVYKYFFTKDNWTKIFAIRQKVQKLKVVSEKEFVRNFSGEIDFQEINNPILKYFVNPFMVIYWEIVKLLIIW